MDWGQPELRELATNNEQLVAWLTDVALPFWDERGVDREGGGFFEEISHAGHAEFCKIRRGRVVARQIYVFSVGKALGWSSAYGDPALHGCDYLFSRMCDASGRFHTAVATQELTPHGPFSLYEQAFYLFALAQLYEGDHSAAIVDAAKKALGRLRQEFHRDAGGFEESSPPSLPLKSNPHMHLLEAAMAWDAATRGADRTPWRELARELVELCLTHFADPASGAVREYFDADWRALPGDLGRIIEPGHQFEWGWLLLCWSDRFAGIEQKSHACRQLARTLIANGERGVDASRNVAVNELWDDFRVKDKAAKLWPQTERLKAWCALLEDARSSFEAERACRGINLAAAGLRQYLLADPNGLWHEVMQPDGHFAPGPAKASSFYHIVCAIDTLRRTVVRCRAESRIERGIAPNSHEVFTSA